MASPRSAGYAFVGEIAEGLANDVLAAYWPAIKPVLPLSLNVPTPAGAVHLNATLAIDALTLTFLPNPSNRIGIRATAKGSAQAVYGNTAVPADDVTLGATGSGLPSINTSSGKTVVVLDPATVTLDSLSVLAPSDLPTPVVAALTSNAARDAFQTALQAQKPLRIAPDLIPASEQPYGIAIDIVDIAVVPLTGILAIAADVEGYTKGDPSKLVDLFATPSPKGAARLIDQRGGPRNEPGGEPFRHGATTTNVALTVNGDALMAFLNGPVAQKFKDVVWEKHFDGPIPLPGPLAAEPFHCRRVALGHQGSMRQLDGLGVDDSGTIALIWVLDQGEWHGGVPIGDASFPPGAPIALGNQRSLDQLTALLVGNDGGIRVLWETDTGSWQTPVSIKDAKSNFLPGGFIALGNQVSLDQLTALAIDDTGTMNVLWVRGTDDWHVPVTFGPSSLQPGGAIAMANQDSLDRLTALTIDAHGTVQVMWVEGSGDWQGPVQIPGTEGRFMPGAPIAVAHQQSLDQLTVLLVDPANNTLNVMWVNADGAWNAPVPIEATAGNVLPQTTVALANQGSLDQLTAVYVDAHGTVQVVWVIGDGAWQGPVAISPPGFTSPGVPASLANQRSMDQLTALVADANHAVHAFWVIGSDQWQGPAPLHVHPPLHAVRASFGYQQTFAPLPGSDTPLPRSVIQLDALAVDENGTLSVLFVNGTEPWQGAIALTGPGFAPSGAIVAAANQGSLDNLTALVVDASGTVQVLWVRDNGRWQGPAPVSFAPFAALPGSPIALANQGSLNQLTGLLCDSDGTLHVLGVTGTDKWHEPVPLGPAKRFHPGGNVAVANQGSLDQITALSVDVDGVVQLFWVDGTGGWQGPVAITGAGFADAGTPIGMANQGSLDQVTAVVVDSEGAVNVLWVSGTGKWQGPVRITPPAFAPVGASVAMIYQDSYRQLSAFVVDATGAVNALWVIEDGTWRGPVPITPSTFATPGASVSVALQNPRSSDEYLDVFVQRANGELVEIWIQKYGITAGPLTATLSDVHFRFGTFTKPGEQTAWPGLLVDISVSASPFSGGITLGFDAILDALGNGDTAWLDRNKGIQGWNLAADYADISLDAQDYLLAAIAGNVLTIINPGLIAVAAVSFIALFDGIVPSLLTQLDSSARNALNGQLKKTPIVGAKFPYATTVPLPDATATMGVTSFDCVVSSEGLDYFGQCSL